MNDLSDQSQTGKTNPNNPPANTSVSSSVNKEVDVGGIDRSGALRDATGQEVQIPKEVLSSGVRIRPTTVPIPQPVSRMGVKPAGANIPVQTVSTVAIPLSDDQIAAGLGQGITSSWRWFSEWCVRRMKQVHIVVKIVHGKLIRGNN
jgi:hypothetical protein